MSRARYLVRFDDICPTMNWEVWERVEAILVERNIKPILAVVPNNRDENLIKMAPRADFWQRVRSWQQQGWSIALHGYEHNYVSSHSGLIGLNAYSEFAGLSHDKQRTKLRNALGIFKENGVTADAWVAPAHSFDVTTVDVLKECGLRVISDGYFWRLIQYMGATWVPQQLWRFRRLPWGVWTVCYHANAFTNSDIDRMAADFSRYQRQIISLDELLTTDQIVKATFMDKAFAWGWMKALRVKRRLRW